MRTFLFLSVFFGTFQKVTFADELNAYFSFYEVTRVDAGCAELVGATLAINEEDESEQGFVYLDGEWRLIGTSIEHLPLVAVTPDSSTEVSCLKSGSVIKVKWLYRQHGLDRSKFD